MRWLQQEGIPSSATTTCYIDTATTARPAARDTAARGHGGPATIAFVGRLTAQKGVDVLAETVSQLCGRQPQGPPLVSFVVAGDGPLRPVLEAVREGLANASCLQLLGAVSRDAMPALYERADLVFMPSRYEGVPAVLYDAMSHGVPVVATHVGGVGELLSNATGALLPTAGNGSLPVAAAVAVLRHLATNAEERKLLGAAARRALAEHRQRRPRLWSCLAAAVHTSDMVRGALPTNHVREAALADALQHWPSSLLDLGQALLDRQAEGELWWSAQSRDSRHPLAGVPASWTLAFPVAYPSAGFTLQAVQWQRLTWHEGELTFLFAVDQGGEGRRQCRLDLTAAATRAPLDPTRGPAGGQAQLRLMEEETTAEAPGKVAAGALLEARVPWSWPTMPAEAYAAPAYHIYIAMACAADGAEYAASCSLDSDGRSAPHERLACITPAGDAARPAVLQLNLL